MEWISIVVIDMQVDTTVDFFHYLIDCVLADLYVLKLVLVALRLRQDQVLLHLRSELLQLLNGLNFLVAISVLQSFEFLPNSVLLYGQRL